ncbi:hypothetical protein J6590_082065, partial [Homalodisca vitripennis]
MFEKAGVFPVKSILGFRWLDLFKMFLGKPAYLREILLIHAEIRDYHARQDTMLE